MIQTGLPQGVKPLHPLPAGQDIHQRVVERVANVQRSGDIGRWQHDAKGFIAAGIGTGGKGLRLFPRGINAPFGNR